MNQWKRVYWIIYFHKQISSADKIVSFLHYLKGFSHTSSSVAALASFCYNPASRRGQIQPCSNTGLQLTRTCCIPRPPASYMTALCLSEDLMHRDTHWIHTSITSQHRASIQRITLQLQLVFTHILPSLVPMKELNLCLNKRGRRAES